MLYHCTSDFISKALKVVFMHNMFLLKRISTLGTLHGTLFLHHKKPCINTFQVLNKLCSVVYRHQSEFYSITFMYLQPPQLHVCQQLIKTLNITYCNFMYFKLCCNTIYLATIQKTLRYLFKTPLIGVINTICCTCIILLII